MSGHDHQVTDLPLTSLTTQCDNERAKFRSREEADPRFCLEIIHRALATNTDEAWAALHECFYHDVRRWVVTHPAAPTILRREDPDIYVQEAFTRLYQSNRNHPIDVSSLPEALSFLRRCVNSAMLDAARATRREPLPLDPIPDVPAPDPLEPVIDEMSAAELWQLVEQCLNTAQERHLARLLWIEGYKPREVPELFPDEFPTIHDVRRCSANVVERLRRRFRP